MKNFSLKKKDLAQYYTSPCLGDVLISMLPIDCSAYDVLDLSAGTGSLLASAAKASPRSKMYGIDLDPENVESIKSKNPNFFTFVGDSLQAKTLDSLSRYCRNFDFVLGNPPFKFVALSKYIRTELNEYFLKNANEKIRAEVYFLAKGLSLLKKGAYLAYILPDGVLTNSGFTTLRYFLVKNFDVLEVKEIPGGAFEGTEAKTHILVIRNLKPENGKKIKLSSIGKETTKLISDYNFIHRADYSYYNLPTPISYVKLSDTKTKIFRGRGGIYYKNMCSLLHTTSFKFNYNEFNGINIPFPNLHERMTIAIKDDILIPRVGSRCIGKVGYVVSGEYFVSDCIIILRAVDSDCRERILASLRSDFGTEWIKTVARGVGAKHITLSDIRNFPVI